MAPSISEIRTCERCNSRPADVLVKTDVPDHIRIDLCYRCKSERQREMPRAWHLVQGYYEAPVTVLSRELERHNVGEGPVAALVAYTHQGLPAGVIKVADDHAQVTVHAGCALALLRALPNGASLGTSDPDPGTVWHALNAAKYDRPT